MKLMKSRQHIPTVVTNDNIRFHNWSNVSDALECFKFHGNLENRFEWLNLVRRQCHVRGRPFSNSLIAAGIMSCMHTDSKSEIKVDAKCIFHRRFGRFDINELAVRSILGSRQPTAETRRTLSRAINHVCHNKHHLK